MSSEIFSNISPLYLATGLFTAVWGFTALRLFTAVWGMKALPFRRVALRTPLLAVVLSICLSGACWGQSAKLSPELRGANVPADLDVIIQYNQTPSESDEQLVVANGGVVKRKFRYVKGHVYHVPAGALNNIASSSNVAYISPDRPLNGLLDQADVTIGANLAASYGVSGSGIGVAVIDSGIANVPDLKGKVVYSRNFNTNTTLGDAYGHGTHVAGIIAGSGKESTGSQFFRTFHGVAERSRHGQHYDRGN
jgi:serine protease AprX